MSGTASHPIAWPALVEYWAGDLPPQAAEAIEEHLMACGECSALAARVAEITESLRAMIPPLLSSEQLQQLQQRGLHIAVNAMQPGERCEVEFPARTDILLHRLGGLTVGAHQRVSIEVTSESTGELLMRLADAPVDRARGEVLVACQRHFAAMPADTVFEIRVLDPDGSARSQRYTVLHRF
ncbi:MAG TPA: zf-HC2 domain-containing protein [Polyangiales bacterium]|nr:zf-HC2 domain-containing protein [Polyangiales bacterium]